MIKTDTHVIMTRAECEASVLRGLAEHAAPDDGREMLRVLTAAITADNADAVTEILQERALPRLRPLDAARLLMQIGVPGRDDPAIVEAHALLTAQAPSLAPLLTAVRVVPRMAKSEAVTLFGRLILVSASGAYYTSRDPWKLASLLVHEAAHTRGCDEEVARAAEARFLTEHAPEFRNLKEPIDPPDDLHFLMSINLSKAEDRIRYCEWLKAQTMRHASSRGELRTTIRFVED